MGHLKKDIIQKVGNENETSYQFDDWIKNRNLVEILDVVEDNIDHPKAKLFEFIQQNSE